LADFLTTEDLLVLINKQQTKQTYDTKIKYNKSIRKKKKINKKTIFFGFLILAILHLLYIFIPLIAPQSAVDIIGHVNVLAVPNNQELGSDLKASVVAMRPFNPNRIEIGTKIAIYGKFGTEIYWVEDIVEIRLDERELDASFDGIIRNTYSFDDIDGIVLRETGIFGMIMYVSSGLRGFISLSLTYAVVFSIIYYLYIMDRKKKVNLSK